MGENETVHNSVSLGVSVYLLPNKMWIEFFENGIVFMWVVNSLLFLLFLWNLVMNGWSRIKSCGVQKTFVKFQIVQFSLISISLGLSYSSFAYFHGSERACRILSKFTLITYVSSTWATMSLFITRLEALKSSVRLLHVVKAVAYIALFTWASVVNVHKTFFIDNKSICLLNIPGSMALVGTLAWFAAFTTFACLFQRIVQQKMSVLSRTTSSDEINAHLVELRKRNTRVSQVVIVLKMVTTTYVMAISIVFDLILDKDAPVELHASINFVGGMDIMVSCVLLLNSNQKLRRITFSKPSLTSR